MSIYVSGYDVLKMSLTIPNTTDDAVNTCKSATRGAYVARCRDGVFLIACVVLAFVLRTYNLDKQSFWCDEFNFVIGKTHNVSDAINLLRFWGPDNVPLYYVVFYFWRDTFGWGLGTARMLSVICGVASIPLAYWIARRIFDSRTGLFTAFCIAISPSQIWHAQSMRPYILCIMLVLLSFYTLQRALAGRKAWWMLTFAINIVLLWTHAHMVFIVPVQALYILGSRAGGWRRAFGWAALQIFAVAPPFFWLLPRMSYVPEAEFDHFILPGVGQTLVDILGDDVMRLSGEFPIAPPAWFTACPNAETWQIGADMILMAMAGLCLLWMLPKARRHWREQDPGPIFVIALIVLPVLLLTVFSYAWRPCVESRHTPYCAVALYMAVGAAIGSIRRPFLRRPLLILFLVLLGFQSAFFLTGGTRTCWREAARVIQSQQGPNDIILVKGIIPYARDTFYDNQPKPSLPVISAHTIVAVSEKTAAYFDRNETNGCVWAVIEMPFFGPLEVENIFSQRLGPLGIQAQYRFYPGMQNLLLVRFERGEKRPGIQANTRVSFTDYDSILAEFGLANLEGEARTQVLNRLMRVIDIPLPLCKNFLCTLSLLLTEEHEYDLGILCAQCTIARAPYFGPAYFALGIANACNQNLPAAREAFQKAFQLDSAIKSLYGDFINALFESNDRECAENELRSLSNAGFPYPLLLRLFLKQYPDASPPDPGRATDDPLYAEHEDRAGMWHAGTK